MASDAHDAAESSSTLGEVQREMERRCRDVEKVRIGGFKGGGIERERQRRPRRGGYGEKATKRRRRRPPFLPLQLDES
jgi:hypothetical protein|tara:strand:+ start:98 stop:331 length:234 start_codon:yes stop_codon:yes gene_type:complete